MFNERSRIVEYDFIRLLLITLVVIGHSTYYQINTLFGGIYYGDMMSVSGIDDTSVHIIAGKIVSYIYTFHMPAFIALSGFFFAKQLNNNKWTFKSLICNKLNTLIYPMLFVWLVWNIPIKLISGYYVNVLEENPLGMFVQIIFPNNVYLWYLQALFCDFIIGYVLYKLTKISKLKCCIVAVLFVCGLCLQKINANYLILGNPLKFFLWFYIGMNMDCIIEYMKRVHIWNLLSLFLFDLVIYILYIRCDIKIIRLFLKELLLPFVGTFLVWRIPFTFANFVNKYKKTIIHISSCGMGIYLYADPLNYLILRYAFAKFGISVFGSNVWALFIIIARIIITSGIAIFITVVLRKIKFPIKAY